MTFSIFFAKQEKEGADSLVVGIFEGGGLTQAARLLNEAHHDVVTKSLESHQNFKGKVGDFISIACPDCAHNRIILVGIGKEDDLDNITCETIGGKLFTQLQKAGAQNINIHIDSMNGLNPAEIAARVALGLRLKSYNFNKYKAEKEDDKKVDIETITMITQSDSSATQLFENYGAVAEGVFFARDLVNEPPNNLNPESYAELIKAELKPLGVDVEILDERKMQKMGFHALLSVGQGSIRESKTVIMKWNGAGKIKKDTKNPIAFVGKGVTFDTGGISLKPGADMDLMKMDMGGSAAVVGLMKALAKRKACANVIGIVGLVENMPSDRAYRPGDIIGSYAGKTIEILNTDAEGRLVLADIMSYIQETYQPEVVIDLATLTGAIMVALGFEYGGAFANDNKLWDQLKEASDNTGEKFWRMPLDKAYRKEMESNVADLKNLGTPGGYGGACTAAGFLEHFVNEGTKWAHIDIAGTAWWKTDKPTTPKGGTGFPVRALNDLVEKHFENKK